MVLGLIPFGNWTYRFDQIGYLSQKYSSLASVEFLSSLKILGHKGSINMFIHDLKKDLLDDGKFTEVNDSKIQDATIAVKDPIALSAKLREYYTQKGEDLPAFQNIEDFIIGFDKGSPTATYSIRNNAAQVDVRDSLEISFSEYITTDRGRIFKGASFSQLQSLVSITKSQNPPIKVYGYTVSVLENNRKILIKFNDVLDFNRAYTVSVVDITDLSGNALSNPKLFFRTQPLQDLRINTSPVAGSDDIVALTNIEILFSHDAYIAGNPPQKINSTNVQGAICLQKDDDMSHIPYSIISASGKKVVIKPLSPLENEKKYLISSCAKLLSAFSQEFPTLKNRFQTKRPSAPTFDLETYKNTSKIETISANQKDVESHVDTLEIVFSEYLLNLQGEEVSDISKHVKLYDADKGTLLNYTSSIEKSTVKDVFRIKLGLNVSKLPYKRNFRLEVKDLKGRSNNALSNISFNFSTKSWEYIPFNGTGSGMDISASGEIFLSGHYSGSPIIFEDIKLSPGPNEKIIFLTKLDNDGNVIWVKEPFSGTGTKEVRDIKWYKDHIYITGNFSGTLTPSRGSSHTSRGGRDIFIAKLRADNGELIDVKTYGSSEDDTGLNLEVSPITNHIFLGGICSERQDTYFGSTTLKGTQKKPGIIGDYKGFILKLDGDLGYKWVFRVLFSYDLSKDFTKRREGKLPFAVGSNDKIYFHATYSGSILFPDKKTPDLTSSGITRGLDFPGGSLYTLAIYSKDGVFEKHTSFTADAQTTQRGFDILATPSAIFLLGSFNSSQVIQGSHSIRNTTRSTANISLISLTLDGDASGMIGIKTMGQDTPYTLLKSNNPGSSGFFLVGETGGVLSLGGINLQQGDVFHAHINDGKSITTSSINKLHKLGKVSDIGKYYHIASYNDRVVVLFRTRIKKVDLK